MPARGGIPVRSRRSRTSLPRDTTQLLTQPIVSENRKQIVVCEREIVVSKSICVQAVTGAGTAAALVSAASSSDSEWFGVAWALVGQRLCIRQTRPGPANQPPCRPVPLTRAIEGLSRRLSTPRLPASRRGVYPGNRFGQICPKSRRPPGLSPLSVPTPPGRSNATVNASPDDGEPKTRHEAKVGRDYLFAT